MTTQEPPVKIRLLGTFEVQRGDRVLEANDLPRKKAANLLKRLALERRLIKDQVIDYLWPVADIESGSNNLYKTLHILRQTLNTSLGPDTAEAIFRFDDGVLSLMPEVWVDAREFERLCFAPPTLTVPQHKAYLEQALDLYQGDLLPDDLYTDWTLLPRQALFRCQREARLALAGYYRESGSYNHAVDLVSPLLVHDPADEPVHRELMRLYALSGQRTEALRQYQVCVDALAAELDLEPSEETRVLYTQILSGDLVPPQSSEVDSRKQVKPFESAAKEDKPRPVFVGRKRELQVMQKHLQAALEGYSQVLFIAGEAGQGKTSLMAEFAYRAQIDHPELIASAGVCQALAGISDPYLPFRDLFGILSGDWQRPWIAGEISNEHAARLQAAAPNFIKMVNTHASDLVGVLISENLLVQKSAIHYRELNQRQIFDQTRQLLIALAERQPLLLLLDDLQWIDMASANLFFYLGRQLRNSPILIVGAYRPSEVNAPLVRQLNQNGDEQFSALDTLHPLASVVQELVRNRGNIRIDLDSYDPLEGRRFVDSLIDSEPNRLDASFRESIYRRTRGQPLFTIELLRALQEQADLIKDQSGLWKSASDLDWEVLPARVEAVIARRIERLPPELRQILALASVEGESFSAEVIAQVQSRPVRPLLQKLSQELDKRYRLVREQGEWRLAQQAITRYQFRHNLFQQYLYHQMSLAERRSLHREIAAVLEEIGADDLDHLAVPLSQHYLAAGDSARAVPYLCRAGDDARRRVALVEAIQFYQSALRHWVHEDPAEKADVTQKLGESLLAHGNSSEAIERFFEADKLYSQVGNRTRMGAMQRLIGRSYFEQGDRAKALEHYHRAMSFLEGEPENVELARAISAIAQMHMTSDNYDDAISWGERAIRLARNLHAEDVILHAMTTVGTSYTGKGEVERGLAMLAESQLRAEDLGLPHDVGRAYAGWGDSLVNLERYDEARAVYERMLAYARKVQAGMFEGVALVQLGYLEWWSGRWRQALARRQEIIDWMATIPGASFAKVWAGNFLGLIYNDLGQPEKARGVLTEHLEVARKAHETQTTVPNLGQFARSIRSERQRAELFQEIMELVDTEAYPRYEVFPALLLACSWMAQSLSGDPNTTSHLEKIHQKWRNKQSTASLAEVRGYAAGIRQEWNEAASQYEEAVRNWEALERPYDQLRSLAGLLMALSNIQVHSTHKDELAAIGMVHSQALANIERLAKELDEPEVNHTFLASPLVMEIRMNQYINR